MWLFKQNSQLTSAVLQLWRLLVETFKEHTRPSRENVGHYWGSLQLWMGLYPGKVGLLKPCFCQDLKHSSYFLLFWKKNNSQYGSRFVTAFIHVSSTCLRNQLCGNNFIILFSESFPRNKAFGPWPGYLGAVGGNCEFLQRKTGLVFIELRAEQSGAIRKQFGDGSRRDLCNELAE